MENKELEIEELTELEVLADLQCYALGSYELDDFETKEAQEYIEEDELEETHHVETWLDY